MRGVLSHVKRNRVVDDFSTAGGKAKVQRFQVLYHVRHLLLDSGASYGLAQRVAEANRANIRDNILIFTSTRDWASRSRDRGSTRAITIAGSQANNRPNSSSSESRLTVGPNYAGRGTIS